MYDIVIVGGGISGLYMYYKLLPNTKNILLLEKNRSFGGRIYQHEEKFNGEMLSFPAGAARFNKNHERVIKLLRDFELLDFRKDKGFPAKIHFIDSKNQFSQKFNNKNGFEYIKKLLKKVDKNDFESLKQYSFQEYANLHLPSDEVEFLLVASGYSGQLKKMNMYDAYNLFKEGIRDDIQYYGGYFHKLIDKIVSKLIKMKCKLYLNSEVKNIRYSNEDRCYIVRYNNTEVKTNKIVLSLPKPALLKLSILEPIHQILEKSIDCKPLCRVYAKYKKEDVWFADIIKTVTNNPLRFIIPIDIEKGIIMISYTDDIYTNYWEKRQGNQGLLKKTVKRLVNNTFKIDSPQPEKVWVFNWNCGVGYWKKRMDSKTISEFLINPIENIYICGENYSLVQSWIEGALESCDRVIKKLE